MQSILFLPLIYILIFSSCSDKKKSEITNDSITLNSNDENKIQIDSGSYDTAQNEFIEFLKYFKEYDVIDKSEVLNTVPKKYLTELLDFEQSYLDNYVDEVYSISKFDVKGDLILVYITITCNVGGFCKDHYLFLFNSDGQLIDKKQVAHEFFGDLKNVKTVFIGEKVGSIFFGDSTTLFDDDYNIIDDSFRRYSYEISEGQITLFTDN